MQSQSLAQGIEILAPRSQEFDRILTPEALEFVAFLERKISPTRRMLLKLRDKRQTQLDRGEMPEFLSHSGNQDRVEAPTWRIAPVPQDLLDRRVEITGPAGDTKMVINALNSGANVYMADFEDSQSPTWEATIEGQINLHDAIRGTIGYTSPEGKEYKLNERTSTLIVRPRGWHLEEKHVLIDGKPVSASIFDFGLFFFHNAGKLLKKGTGPYFYIPKLESRLEAGLWNEVFSKAEEKLELPHGTIRATVLIETILAAFEMEEILYELKDYILGLNCGRWDYIFSFIKKFRSRPVFVLPDRSVVTMDTEFLTAYVDLLIKTCHKHGAYAMGGMAAQIPIKNDPKANEAAFEKVRADKEREVFAGHDGTWVAHPGLVPLAKQVFDARMPSPNQVFRLREDAEVSAQNLIEIPDGKITEGGLRRNVDVSLQYLESWLRGKGSVPIYNLMEDTATAEICRAQIWQWIVHKAVMTDGKIVTVELFRSIMKEEIQRIRRSMSDVQLSVDQYDLASKLLDDMITSNNFVEFLTTYCYDALLSLERGLGHKMEN